METVVTVDGQGFDAKDLINYLKLNNEFDEIVDRMSRDKVTVCAGAKRGITVSTEELQENADNLRRHVGLHRAKDTQGWLDEQNLTIDDLEGHVHDMVMKRKVMEEVVTDAAIEAYFQQHSPKFDTVDLKQIVLDDEGKAKEMAALLDDDLDLFEELVQEHSIDPETRKNGGVMKGVRRGTLAPEVEAKLFNAANGEIVGPMQLGDSDFYEVFVVTEKHPASLTDFVKDEVGETLFNDWLAERMEEISVSVG